MDHTLQVNARCRRPLALYLVISALNHSIHISLFTREVTCTSSRGSRKTHPWHGRLGRRCWRSDLCRGPGGELLLPHNRRSEVGSCGGQDHVVSRKPFCKALCSTRYCSNFGWNALFQRNMVACLISVESCNIFARRPSMLLSFQGI